MTDLTKLAEGGIAYNHFHTTAMCSPTRTSLLTGRNHTHVGAGQIAKFAVGMDLGSPVALDYYDRASFKFNGKIERINIKYI